MGIRTVCVSVSVCVCVGASVCWTHFGDRIL